MGRTRVAIVDDHTIVRDGIVRLLSGEPAFDIVGACGSAADAVRLAGDARPDVLLLDLALPDANGLDVIAPIGRASPATRVLVLSMHAEPAYASAALDRGAWGLVSKAASPDELIAAIERVAAGERIPVMLRLLPREARVLLEIAHGKTNVEIASLLGIQPKTVEGYTQKLMDKLDIHTRAGLVAYGRRASTEV